VQELLILLGQLQDLQFFLMLKHPQPCANHPQALGIKVKYHVVFSIGISTRVDQRVDFRSSLPTFASAE